MDVMHVVKKLWDAGSSVHREGSPECRAWVEARKDDLYAGNAARIVAEFDRQLAGSRPLVPATNSAARSSATSARTSRSAPRC
jgi:hypothetical protein